MKIPDESARQAILDRVDMVAALIEAGLPLEERGHDLFVPCLFHEESTGSLHVTVRGFKRGLFYCFGCMARGTIADLVAVKLDLRDERQEADGEHPIDVGQGWAWLARRAGVSLDPIAQAREGAVSTPPTPWKVDPVPRPLLVHPDGSVPAAESPDAVDYLAHRGIDLVQAARHRLRYWPSRRRLVVPSYVRGRLAIWDARAIDLACASCGERVPAHADRRCASCGGRLLDLAPKTWGAPERDGARPREAVFGYDWLRQDATVLACEGPFGAMALERLGHQACALRGSRLHTEQAALLAAFPRVVVLGDGDAAGAGLEAQLAPLRARTEVLFACLDDGRQPDDLGPHELREVLARARAPRTHPRPDVRIVPTPPKPA